MRCVANMIFIIMAMQCMHLLQTMLLAGCSNHSHTHNSKVGCMVYKVDAVDAIGDNSRIEASCHKGKCTGELN